MGKFLKESRASNMTRALIVIGAVCLGTLSLTAQHPDPDKKVAGGGSLPAGWKGRLDNGDKSLAGARVMLMGQGVHFTTGPAGIYYKASDKPLSGSYEVKATFTQMQPAAHPEAYGLIVGGSNLDAPNQKYTYFLVRQDGKFMIKRRSGEETPTVADWTDSAAIKKTEGSAKGINTLAIRVAPDTVRFLVNGTEVSSADASRVDTTGVAGLRINHNLNVMVDNFTAK
jgi:hypothetical protein